MECTTKRILKTFSLAALVLTTASTVFSAAPTSYTATKASVDQHVASPEWFKDAKLGVYFHWGLFSVPNHSTEWYGTYMYDKTNAVSSWHTSNMGDQWASSSSSGYWGYDQFATGKKGKNGNNYQFAPKLKSAGGNFDPQEFADVIDSAGAWYAGPMAMHHDGWANWDSKATEWCSTQKGPKIDILKILTDAFRSKNMKIVASFHHAYHIGGFWRGVPAQSDPSLKKFYAQQGTATEQQLWYDVLKEVTDQYQPDVIWHDFGLNSAGDQLLKHYAYYYNKGLEWKKDVVIVYKNGSSATAGQVYDYERNMPTDIQSTYWEADDGVSSSTWAYRDGMTFFPAAAILHGFIDRVSKNGNLLLNFGPKPDGTIPPEVKNIMYTLGAYLHPFGETIYCTRAWSVFGEGPTRWGKSSGYVNLTSPGKSSDIRYTMSKDKNNVYAIFLGWPGNNTKVTLTAVTSSRLPLTAASKVYLYGLTPASATSLQFTQNASGLQVTFPSSQPYTNAAYPLKISLTGEAPKACPPKPWEETGLVNQPKGLSSGNATLSQSASMAKMIHTTKGLTNGILIPQNATGVAVYSLQGRKLFNKSFSSNPGIYRFEDFKSASSQTYYVKLLTR